MSNYTKATNFATKDTLPTGDSNKIVKGTEIDNEFNAISGAISSKADLASPTFTGAPAAPTAAAGSNTTQVATTAHVFAERTNTATLTNKTLTSPVLNTPTINTATISGGSITGITDLAVADGGTGASTLTGVVIGNGTSAMTAVAPSTSGNVLTSNGTTWASTAPVVVKGLGLGGEVWNDVTGSRSQGVTYTNSRSYPIQVSGNFGCNTGGQGQIYIDGVLVSYWAAQFNGCGGFSVNMPCIVPPGATYMLAAMNGSARGWYELY